MTTEEKLSSADLQPELMVNAQLHRLHIVCWTVLIIIAVIRAWLTRYELYFGDSVAYLDIAREIAAGHFGAAIHAYWSPAYPVIVSLFLRAFRPGIFWEFPFVHFINVLIFIGTLACFQLFWTEVRLWHQRYADAHASPIPITTFWAIGYSAFSIATLNIIRIGLIGPDLLVAAFCCLAGWCVLRLRRSPGVARSLLLGIVLGLGYYAKAPFFPLAFVFVFCACFWLPVSRRALCLGGLALVTFLIVCAPFIAALSVAKGRFTFGDSARLNQAFYINGVQHHQHWQGGPKGAGMPVHPTRKLNDYPEIYEFAVANMGTYPAWYDPTYWYEGITPHLDWKRQVIVFLSNLVIEINVILGTAAELVCILIILALLVRYRGMWSNNFWHSWFIWMPGAIALLMFALVHIEQRFLGGWLLLIFAGGVAACFPPANPGTRRAVQCIGMAAIVAAAASLTLQIGREIVAGGTSSRSVSIAAYLLRNGLHPGDNVALIGNGSEAYWAYLAQLHVIAEIPAAITSRPGHPALDFWESGQERQRKSLEILEHTGAKAVIAGSQLSMESSVPAIVPSPWRRIDETGAYVYFFPVDSESSFADSVRRSH